MTAFKEPEFTNEQSVELRCTSGEVCIYGTPSGLRRLSELIATLSRAAENDHVHLEDYGLLTFASLKAVIAVFPPDREK